MTSLNDTPFVRVNAQREFEVGGRVFVPQGFNSYPLLQLAGYDRLDAVNDIFDQALDLGRPLIRTNAFMDAGDHPARIRADDGSLREEGLRALDRVLAAAAARGVRLLLTLTNNWEDFGGAPAVLDMVAPGQRLPKNAFWTDPRAIDAQLGYQTALATRVNSVNGRVYREDPTIFAWELANEARCEREWMSMRRNGSTLARWAKRMSDGLRQAGVQQLIAWGGVGYLGEYGEDLRLIGRDGGVDVLTLHLYASALPKGSGPEAAIAWGERVLRERKRAADEVNLPLLLEEVNWRPDDGSDVDTARATVLAAWLELADHLRIGTLPWMIGERGRTDYDGYLIRPEDTATRAVLRRT